MKSLAARNRASASNQGQACSTRVGSASAATASTRHPEARSREAASPSRSGQDMPHAPHAHWAASFEALAQASASARAPQDDGVEEVLAAQWPRKPVAST